MKKVVHFFVLIGLQLLLSILGDQLSGQSNMINSKFSPDGNKIAVVIGKNIKIWDLQKGGFTFLLKGHSDEIQRVWFDPTGQKLVSFASDENTKIWDLTTGKNIASLGIIFQEFEFSNLKNIDFSSDGLKIVIAYGMTAIVYDTRSGKQLLSISIEEKHSITNSLFSPDNKKILTFGENQKVTLWDAFSGKEIRNLGEYSRSAPVRAACFSPNGDKVVIIYDYRKPIIWEVSTGESLKNLNLESYPYLTKIDYADDGKSIIASTPNNDAFIWDATTGMLLKPLPGFNPYSMETVSIIPQFYRNDHFIVASHEDTVFIWETKQPPIPRKYKLGSVIQDFQLRKGKVLSSKYSTLLIHNLETGTLDYALGLIGTSNWFIFNRFGEYDGTIDGINRIKSNGFKPYNSMIRTKTWKHVPGLKTKILAEEKKKPVVN